MVYTGKPTSATALEAVNFIVYSEDVRVHVLSTLAVPSRRALLSVESICDSPG